MNGTILMTQTEILWDNAQVVCYNKFCTVWHDIVVPAFFRCAKLHDEKVCVFEDYWSTIVILWKYVFIFYSYRVCYTVSLRPKVWSHLSLFIECLRNYFYFNRNPQDKELGMEQKISPCRVYNEFKLVAWICVNDQQKVLKVTSVEAHHYTIDNWPFLPPKLSFDTA